MWLLKDLSIKGLNFGSVNYKNYEYVCGWETLTNLYLL